ncbi:phage tail protein [Piscinibacter terrae]|uniref:Phage tail protein n=1 Tax=Piscinibacter terrae TaxID=2496871 RepID=A0A3N7HM16_9BURK|nr:tail fiber protein [Albitalea terrae]RQP23187.1 phage tail protein [Albitalea terrae]
MSDPFLGEMKMVGFNFAPRGYAFCDGSILSIASSTALFSLLGTMYGGNGVSTFGLPDLRGRSPVGMGSGPGLTPIVQGEVSGTENTTILSTQMPMHTHLVTVAGTPTEPAVTPSATNNVLGASVTGSAGAASIWSTALNSPVQLAPTQVGVAGGSQPLPIRNPYIGTNFIIATEGIFPSRP